MELIVEREQEKKKGGGERMEREIKGRKEEEQEL